MKIAITGANGFVGQSLCQSLADQGFEVLALCRQDFQNNRPNITYLKVDYKDPGALTRQLIGTHTLIHLIAKTHAEDHLEALPQYKAINVELTKTVAHCAAEAGIDHFIYLSSIKVNGEATTDTPFDRHSHPAPTTAYGISKWEAEQALIEVYHQTSLNITAIRCPLIYSPDAQGNIRTLRKAISKGIPLPLGSIRNKRDIIDLKLLNQQLIELCRNNQKDNQKNNRRHHQTLLVSNGKALSTSELAQKLGDDIGTPAKILPFPVAGLKLIFACLGKSQAFTKLCDNLELTTNLPSALQPTSNTATSYQTGTNQQYNQ